MTFSINPTAEKTHAMFQALAIAQNGAGADSAIVGGAAPPPADPAAAPSGAASSPVSIAAPSATGSAGGAAGTGVVSGTGTIGQDGLCACAVTCSFDGASFPAPIQGRDSFGGMAGAVPIAMAG